MSPKRGESALADEGVDIPGNRHQEWSEGYREDLARTEGVDEPKDFQIRPPFNQLSFQFGSRTGASRGCAFEKRARLNDPDRLRD